MKQSQMIISLVVLTGVVFLVTFLMNYVGDTGSTPSSPSRPTPKTAEKAPELKFAQMQHPLQNMYAPIQEIGTDGFHDFWFVNDNKESIELILDETTCKCTEVRVFIVPDEYRGLMETETILQAFAATPKSAAASALEMALAGVNEARINLIRKEADDKGGTKLVKASGKGCDIPGGTNGWVRMFWKANNLEAAGPAVRSAVFSTQYRNASPIRLDCGLILEVPFRVLNLQESIGELDPRQLPVEVPITVWSASRTELDLEARQAKVRGTVSVDPIRIGTPVKATPEEINVIEEKAQRRVRCAYKIPITIRDRDEGKNTLVDLGSFYRRIEVRSKKDPENEPVVVVVSGSIMGDIAIEGNGRINLPDFFARNGSRKGICNLSTNLENLKVEVDRDRTAKFLSVKVGEMEKVGGRSRIPLEVWVEPNKAQGRFPREDDPDYQDSAIYLKTTGAISRNIRIAVDGIAKER